MINVTAILKTFTQRVKTSQTAKKIIFFGFLSFVTSIAIVYWIYNKRYITTDDAYVNANYVQVAAQVTGQLISLNVKNNQQVKKNQLLFKLDQAPFNIAIKKNRAQLAQYEAELHNAELTAIRLKKLEQKHSVSSQAVDDAITNLKKAQANIELTKANLAQTKLDLLHTEVFAITDGLITNMTIQEGDVVNANQPLFALVNNTEYWIDANFKETELASIRNKQPVTIQVDMYPNQLFKGIVESVSSSTGSAFSLLPPQNATGNWVKITQRVPVKILILNPLHNYPLRIGTSASVTIDTQKNITN